MLYRETNRSMGQKNLEISPRINNHLTFYQGTKLTQQKKKRCMDHRSKWKTRTIQHLEGKQENNFMTLRKARTFCMWHKENWS